MTINKKGKKKTIVAKNESEVASTSSTSSALDVTSSESIEKSSTVVSSTSKVVQEARSIAESESRSNVVEVTSGSREVIMDSKGNVIKVIEQQPKTSKQFSTMSKTGASSQDFISGEQTQSIQQRKDHRSSVGDQKVKIINKKDKDESLRHHSATSSYSDIREEASSSSHKSVTASSTKNSSTSLTQDQHISSSSPTVHTSSSQSKHSSEISAHGIEKDGKLHVDTKKTSSSQSRLNVDGNVVSSSSHNVENQSFVEPSTTSHVTFVDDRRSSHDLEKKTNAKQVKTTDRPSKPGDSSWDGKFVYEKSTTPKVSRVSTDVSNKSDDTTLSVSSYEESSTVISTGLSTHLDSTKTVRDMTEQIERSGTLPSKASGKKTNDNTKRTNEPIADRLIGKHHSVEISDVTEEQNITDASTSSYIVEYKDAKNASKHVERITSVSSTILEEDIPSTPLDTSTPKRPGRPEKSSRPDVTPTSYKPGQSTWDGSFVYEKSPAQTPQRPERKRPDDSSSNITDRRLEHINIRDVTEDNSINEADIVTTSYTVEHSSSQQSVTDIRETSLSSVTIIDDGYPRNHPDIPKNGRTNSPENHPGERDVRTIKPGASTWDGTFKYEEKIPDVDKRTKDVPRHPAGKPTNVVSTSGRRNVSDTTLNIGDDFESSIDVSDVLRESIIVEQSRIHESYKDSTNIDLESTSVETVIIRDGTPKATRRVTSDVNVKELEHSDSSEKKTREHPDDRSERPTKVGSSTWDGSFVYEKTPGSSKHPTDLQRRPDDTDNAKRPSDLQRRPDDTDNASWTKRPGPRDSSDVIDYTTSKVIDIKQDVSSTSEFTTVEKSFTDTKIHDASNVASNAYHQVSDDRRSDRNIQISSDSLQRPDDLDKEHPDRATRPQKPGSSTWDGSFVYEKPSGAQKPADAKTNPGDNKGLFTDVAKSPKDAQKYPKSRGPSTVDYTTSSSVHDVFNTVHENTSTNSVINVERQLMENVRRSDTSNVSTTISRDVPDRRTLEKPTDGSSIRGPKDNERPRPSSRSGSPEKSPGDRTERPQKPGSSTWDGSFVYEKPSSPQKPKGAKSKLDDEKGRPTDVEKSPKDVQKHPRPRGPNETVHYTTSSGVHDVFNTVHEQTSAFINVERQTTDDVKTSDTSNVSTTIVRDVTDLRTPVRPTNSAPIRGSKDNERPERPRRSSRSDSPEKSPGDRTERPQKPGSSTWDGSFVHEKPSGPQKPADTKTKPGDSKGRPTDVEKSPKDVQKHPRPRGPNETVDYTTSSNVHDVFNTVHEQSNAFINIERQTTDDVRTTDISNVSTTITRDVADRRTPVRPVDGAPIRGPKDNERPERPRRSSRPDSPEKSPGDRTERPQKPGSSTWDGSFVHEKPSGPQKPADTKTKPGDSKGRPTDVEKSPKDVQKHPGPRGPNHTVNYTTSSSVHDVFNTVHEQENAVINVERQTTDDMRTSNISNVSTTITRDVADRRTPVRPVDGALIRGPKDNERPEHPRRSSRPDSPEKSPGDRTDRPQKPGSSTWDGSFVYEKPLITQKPTDMKTKPGDNKARPTDVEKTPKDVQKHPRPCGPNETVDYTTSSDVHDVFNTVHEQSNAFINIERQTTDDVRTSDISNVSTTITRDVADRRTPVRPVDGAPIREPKDNERPERPRRSSRPDSPEKSPGDRTERPQKPGSSTWDGSFVYEKPSITQKPTDTKTKPDDNKGHPRDVKKSPKDVQKHPGPRGPNETVNYTTSSSVHDISNTAVINVERQTIDDVITSDTSNVSTTIVRDVSDHRTPVRPTDGAPIRGPKDNERPERPRWNSRPGSPEKSPGDRTERPQKPGSSTWDGSFVYEKPSSALQKPSSESQKPADMKTKPGDGKGRPVPTDVGKSPKDVQQRPKPRGPNETVNYTTSSSIHDISNTVHENTNTFINVEKQSTEDVRTRDTSNVSTTIVRDIPDRKHPGKPTDGTQIRGPKDERPRPSGRPGSPEKSPSDRTERPQKPGSSTWDGSFTYEKPQEVKKPKEQEKKSPVGPTGKPGTPGDKGDRKPRKPQERNGLPSQSIILRESRDKLDVTDVTDITDTVVTSEVVQHSSYVIDQSSSFTSITDIKDVVDISDVRKSSIRDVVS